MKTPLADLTALKKSTDLIAVIQSRGIKLKKQGNDMVGLCPFHEEKTPSFRVTPSKNLFHCFGCGAAGSVIDFVMKKDGFSKQQAIDWLVRQSGGAIQRGSSSAKATADEAPTVESASKAAMPLMLEGERAKLLKRVAAFYAKTLAQDRQGIEYLKSRNLADPTMLDVFQVGYCNGTLNKALPKGGAIIEQLKAVGVLNKRGNEHFKGCVTVPIFNTQGNICGIYGRRIIEQEPKHLYLPGPHRGIFNGSCAKSSQSLFITESIFDAMALWQAGFRNVIPIYGTEGWTPDHEALLRESGTTETFLCLDNDDAGKRATERLKEKLSSIVKALHTMNLPDEVKDVADFFISRSAADFETLVKAANPASEQKSDIAARLGDEQITMTPDGFNASYGSRHYELRAIERPSAARMKATVKALSQEQGRFHIDTVDFYLSRSRRTFIGEAARLFRDVPDVIEMDLNRLTVQVETYVEKRMEEKSPAIILVSESEKLEAHRLGRNPDLIGEILRDMEKLGAVGEETNKLIGYLVMTARKMDDPLALLTLSSSGAGKSHLQDMILSLCPEEDLIKLTSLSDRALFYKGEDSLKHKVLAVEEEAGASGAFYAIRNLISSKKLVIETTIKNPLTGKMETQVNRVNGPTAVFQTTTNPETDAETRSRFIITSVDESPEQTHAILAAQRNAHTLEGMRQRHRRTAILARHHAFQRMLKPLAVLNPFEPLLSYGDDRLLDRRDNPKYLSLILVVAFLRQMQRAVKRDEETGRDYIEATLEDIAVANDLATALFGLSLDDLSPPARRLLRQIAQWVGRESARLKTDKIRFNRRQLRETFKWTETRLRVHLCELVRMEYILPVGGAYGKAYEYQLACDPSQIEEEPLFMPGLKSVQQLQKEARVAGVKSASTSSGQANLAAVLPNLAAQKRGVAATSPQPNGEVLKAHFPSENGNGKAHLAAYGGERIRNGACACEGRDGK